MTSADVGNDPLSAAEQKYVIERLDELRRSIAESKELQEQQFARA